MSHKSLNTGYCLHQIDKKQAIVSIILLLGIRREMD